MIPFFSMSTQSTHSLVSTLAANQKKNGISTVLVSNFVFITLNALIALSHDFLISSSPIEKGILFGDNCQHIDFILLWRHVVVHII